jgi:methionyl-tRNA formyltransferase
MKIIVCLNKDVYAAIVLNLLLPYFKNHQVRIVLSDDIGDISRLPNDLIELKSYEQQKLSELFDVIDHKRKLPSEGFLTFNQIAEFFQSKVSVYQDINSNQALEDMELFAPDLIISIRYSKAFSKKIISMPKRGIINLHGGILPDYRGIMASFWSIFMNYNPGYCDSEIGATLYYVNDVKNDGKIIDFYYSKVDFSRSLMFNIAKVYFGAYQMIVDFLEKIGNGSEIKIINPTRTIIASNDNNYFSYPRLIHLQKFLEIMPLYTKKDYQELISNWENNDGCNKILGLVRVI